jgi:hypothetical protein
MNASDLIAGELAARIEELLELEADELESRLAAIAEPMLEEMAAKVAEKLGRLEARLEKLYREGREDSAADDDLEELLADGIARLEELGRRLSAVQSAKAGRRELAEHVEMVETNAAERREQHACRAAYVAERDALAALLKVGRLRRELELGLEERLETCAAVIEMFDAAIRTLELVADELGRAW